MADPKAVYGIPAGTNYNLAIRAPVALYDSLTTELGLTKFDTPSELSKTIIVEAAKFLNRLRVTYKTPAGNRTGGLWVARDKFEEAKASLDGKNFRTFPIQDVGQPLDSSRH